MNPTRREFLAAAAFAPVARADEPKPAVIDTHTHFYDPTRPEGVPWPGKGDKVLYRKVLPAEFRKLAAPHGVTGTVVVEASPWVEDNQWLLDLAKDEPFVVGVVGRLLPGDADFRKHLARFARNPLFRGIRWNAADLRDALKGDAPADPLRAFSDTGLTLDVNGGPEVLPLAGKLADRLPKLRVVVNHLGNVVIDGKEPPAEWVKGLKTAAGGPNVWCKLSALVDGTRKRDGTAPADPAFYRPVFDAVWSAFGPDRLLFGSNWPVSDLYAPFATVYDIVAKLVAGKGADAVRKVFGGNAANAYQLTRT